MIFSQLVQRNVVIHEFSIGVGFVQCWVAAFDFFFYSYYPSAATSAENSYILYLVSVSHFLPVCFHQFGPLLFRLPSVLFSPLKSLLFGVLLILRHEASRLFKCVDRILLMFISSVRIHKDFLQT